MNFLLVTLIEKLSGMLKKLLTKFIKNKIKNVKNINLLVLYLSLKIVG